MPLFPWPNMVDEPGPPAAWASIGRRRGRGAGLPSCPLLPCDRWAWPDVPPFRIHSESPISTVLFTVLLPMGHSPSSQRTALPLMSLPARQRGGRAPVKGPQTRFHQSSVHPQPHPACVSTQTSLPPPLPISLSLGRIHASSWILDVPLDLVALVKFGLAEASMGLSGG